MSYHDEHECSVTEPHVHPEDFGAVADGETDDAPAIQQAIIEAQRIDGFVSLAEHTYRVTNTVQTGSDLDLGKFSELILATK